ncbi:MAG: hypothetical protein C0601_01525 [Candidatus Muiribacterium halophilum]|uniref:Formylmethanofuran dehydrogenase subunit E domain-containing protein n=1 Tax=Muiribacterium halophilum TaxID=2053465 RepID=A0A2N5ZLQ0_MUIH1|nr:MAG: hypothetical protein C0601_01525 [Candidatus Muirbacterium halophilum]
MSEYKDLSFDITDDLLEKVIEYHSKKSPGVIIGTYLLKYLMDNLGPVKGKLHVVSETGGCFPDVVSAILSRTIGNKYLRIMEYGLVAYTAYGRDEPEKALRVYLDNTKIDKDKYPYLYGFCHGSRPHDKFDRPTINELTIKDFLKVKYDIFEKEWLKNVKLDYKLPKKKIVICDQCNITFSTLKELESTCPICKDKDLYFTK